MVPMKARDENSLAITPTSQHWVRPGHFEMDDGRDSAAAKPTKADKVVKQQSNPDFPTLNRYSIQDLEAFTHNFDRNNLIGLTQFGQLYRRKLEETGREARSVTIKKWSDSPTCYRYNFGWIQRIKVALALARLLKFLHRKENSYLVQNVDTAHIILDQDYNPFIIDFGLMSGGIIGDMTDAKHATPMTPGYTGTWSTYSEVFSYGVIAIELITKRITENDDLSRGGASTVELGKRCIEFRPNKRPFMFGQLYRGKLEEIGKEARSVTIKKWSDPPTLYLYTHDIDVMLNEELKFLTHLSMSSHPNLVKLIGYCCEEQIKGAIYDLNPMDTLHNVMTKDNFDWIQRIKITLALARLLKFLHKKGNSYLVRNVDTAHIILDQDYNPFIVDFGLMSGGIIGDMTDAKDATPMTPCYNDIFGVSSGMWGTYSDV
ncbi:hypothetical protein DITRI_Ditri06bG0124700 [Diplodiscus trichospermus]